MHEFTWIVKVFNDTIQYQCCLDSNGIIIETDRDLITFQLTHVQYIEYQRYLFANKRSIAKQDTDPYRY